MPGRITGAAREHEAAEREAAEQAELQAVQNDGDGGLDDEDDDRRDRKKKKHKDKRKRSRLTTAILNAATNLYRESLHTARSDR